MEKHFKILGLETTSTLEEVKKDLIYYLKSKVND